MLFILVGDSLNKFLRSAEQVMPQHIALNPQFIQYAGDMVVITYQWSPTRDTEDNNKGS